MMLARLIIIAVLLCSSQLMRAVLPALDYATVSNAVYQSVNGDVIILPAGTTNWDQTLVVSNKAITLRGAGMYATTVTNTQTGATAAEQKEAIVWYATTNGPSRITSIGFHSNGTNNFLRIEAWGQLWPVMRVDRVAFYEGRFAGNNLWKGTIAGLQDQCVFINCEVGFRTLGTGNHTWSIENPVTVGTTNAVVVEDCYFVNAQSLFSSPSVLSANGTGSRQTFRYNTWSNTFGAGSWLPVIDVHGNVNDTIGQRQTEIYGNTFAGGATGDTKLSDFRGGLIFCFSNRWTGASCRTVFTAREEDESVYAMEGVTNYPAIDQHWMWLGANTVNGTLVSEIETFYPEDGKYLLAGTNYFFTLPPSTYTTTEDFGGRTWSFTNYTPLVYPHPLRRAQDGLMVRVHKITAGSVKLP